MVAIFAAFFPPGTVISRPSLDDPDRVDGLQVKEGGVEGVSGVGKAAGPVIGRACQRFALQATALGLKHAFVNQPVEVTNLRPELAALVCMPGRRPDIVMRFGYGPTLPFSARRPVEAVLA